MTAPPPFGTRDGNRVCLGGRPCVGAFDVIDTWCTTPPTQRMCLPILAAHTHTPLGFFLLLQRIVGGEESFLVGRKQGKFAITLLHVLVQITTERNAGRKNPRLTKTTSQSASSTDFLFIPDLGPNQGSKILASKQNGALLRADPNDCPEVPKVPKCQN
jgi:hypothetical protein